MPGTDLHLTDTCLRRCASLISKPDIQDFEGLQASAMWVRRALQRAEPRAPLGFQRAMRGQGDRCSISVWRHRKRGPKSELSTFLGAPSNILPYFLILILPFRRIYCTYRSATYDVARADKASPRPGYTRVRWRGQCG